MEKKSEESESLAIYRGGLRIWSGFAVATVGVSVLFLLPFSFAMIGHGNVPEGLGFLLALAAVSYYASRFELVGPLKIVASECGLEIYSDSSAGDVVRTAVAADEITKIFSIAPIGLGIILRRNSKKMALLGISRHAANLLKRALEGERVENPKNVGRIERSVIDSQIKKALLELESRKKESLESAQKGPASAETESVELTLHGDEVRIQTFKIAFVFSILAILVFGLLYFGLLIRNFPPDDWNSALTVVCVLISIVLSFWLIFLARYRCVDLAVVSPDGIRLERKGRHQDYPAETLREIGTDLKDICILHCRFKRPVVVVGLSVNDNQRIQDTVLTQSKRRSGFATPRL